MAEQEKLVPRLPLDEVLDGVNQPDEALRLGIGRARAMVSADARRDAERGDPTADPVRIARDLPDVVIQRLFSMALKLAGTVQLIDNDDVSRSVQDVMDELDATIREIRTTIFAIQSSEHRAQPSS